MLTPDPAAKRHGGARPGAGRKPTVTGREVRLVVEPAVDAALDRVAQESGQSRSAVANGILRQTLLSSD